LYWLTYFVAPIVSLSLFRPLANPFLLFFAPDSWPALTSPPARPQPCLLPSHLAAPESRQQPGQGRATCAGSTLSSSGAGFNATAY